MIDHCSSGMTLRIREEGFSLACLDVRVRKGMAFWEASGGKRKDDWSSRTDEFVRVELKRLSLPLMRQCLINEMEPRQPKCKGPLCGQYATFRSNVPTIEQLQILKGRTVHSSGPLGQML
jgi:hypothetical protein